MRVRLSYGSGQECEWLCASFPLTSTFSTYDDVDDDDDFLVGKAGFRPPPDAARSKDPPARLPVCLEVGLLRPKGREGPVLVPPPPPFFESLVSSHSKKESGLQTLIDSSLNIREVR